MFAASTTMRPPNRSPIVPGDGVRYRCRNDDFSVDLQPAIAWKLVVSRPERQAVDLAESAPRLQQSLDIEPARVRYRPIDVGHADYPGAEPGQVPGARAPH